MFEGKTENIVLKVSQCVLVWRKFRIKESEHCFFEYLLSIARIWIGDPYKWNYYFFLLIRFYEKYGIIGNNNVYRSLILPLVSLKFREMMCYLPSLIFLRLKVNIWDIEVILRLYPLTKKL